MDLNHHYSSRNTDHRSGFQHQPGSGGNALGSHRVAGCLSDGREAGELVFETEAQSGRVTPVTLAQHGYFNLAGEASGPATGHVVRILANEVMTTDERMTPLGRAEPVDGLAVNQNMRYDPSVKAAKALIERCELGDAVFATIDMRGIPHWQPWQAETGGATMKVMSIHHLDCMRYWFGDPERVFCSVRPDPRTEFLHQDASPVWNTSPASGSTVLISSSRQ